jgi:hypothetical protein
MDTSSQRVAAAFSRMQGRDGLRSRADGCSLLVPSGRLVGFTRDDRIQADATVRNRMDSGSAAPPGREPEVAPGEAPISAAWWCRAAGRLAVSPGAFVAGRRVRQNRGVRVERNRENVFTVTATGQELSALLAGARLALDAMRASPEAPATAIELLGRVLDDFDRARERLSEPPNGDRR